MPPLNKQSTKILSEINKCCGVQLNKYDISNAIDHELIWKDVDPNSFRDTDGSDSKAPRDYYDRVGIHF